MAFDAGAVRDGVGRRIAGSIGITFAADQKEKRRQEYKRRCAENEVRIIHIVLQ